MFKKLDDHADLSSRMGKRAGADIGGKVATGDLSADFLRAAILRCATCGEVCACRALLDGDPGQGEVPDYCLNKTLFDDLSKTS